MLSQDLLVGGDALGDIVGSEAQFLVLWGRFILIVFVNRWRLSHDHRAHHLAARQHLQMGKTANIRLGMVIIKLRVVQNFHARGPQNPQGPRFRGEYQEENGLGSRRGPRLESLIMS